MRKQKKSSKRKLSIKIVAIKNDKIDVILVSSGKKYSGYIKEEVQKSTKVTRKSKKEYSREIKETLGVSKRALRDSFNKSMSFYNAGNYIEKENMCDRSKGRLVLHLKETEPGGTLPKEIKF